MLSQSNSATKTELLSEVRSNRKYSAICMQVNDRWVLSPDGIDNDDELRSQYLLQALADGLWVLD